MLQAPLMIRKTALSALHNQLVLFMCWYPWFSHSVTPFIKDEVKCSHSVVYDLADIQKRLKISRTTAYDFVRKVYKEKGPFPVLKIGKMYRIPKAGFEQWISGKHSG